MLSFSHICLSFFIFFIAFFFSRTIVLFVKHFEVLYYQPLLLLEGWMPIIEFDEPFLAVMLVLSLSRNIPVQIIRTLSCVGGRIRIFPPMPHTTKTQRQVSFTLDSPPSFMGRFRFSLGIQIERKSRFRYTRSSSDVITLERA